VQHVTRTRPRREHHGCRSACRCERNGTARQSHKSQRPGVVDWTVIKERPVSQNRRVPAQVSPSVRNEHRIPVSHDHWAGTMHGRLRNVTHADRVRFTFVYPPHRCQSTEFAPCIRTRRPPKPGSCKARHKHLGLSPSRAAEGELLPRSRSAESGQVRPTIGHDMSDGPERVHSASRGRRDDGPLEATTAR